MRLRMSFLDAVSQGLRDLVEGVGKNVEETPDLFAGADGQQLLAPPLQRRLGPVREPLHECREQVVRRICGEVLSKPVDREPLAEAVHGGLLGQVQELSGVDGSDGAGKGRGHAEMIPRSLRGAERSDWPGCDLRMGRSPDFLELLGGELFGVVAFPFRNGQLGCDPEPAVVLTEAACVAGPLPLGEGGSCDRDQLRPFEFDRRVTRGCPCRARAAREE
jgi:hypothetical protein